MELGDDAKYAMKGEGTIRLHLKSEGTLEAKNMMFVPKMKNLLSVSVMENRGYVFMFRNGQVLICPKDSSLDIAMAIKLRDINLYRLKGKRIQALLHDSNNRCKLWHKRLEHLHYKALSILREIVTSLPNFSIEQQGISKGCVLGNNAKAAFPNIQSSSNEILDLIHSNVCGPMLAALV